MSKDMYNYSRKATAIAKQFHYNAKNEIWNLIDYV